MSRPFSNPHAVAVSTIAAVAIAFGCGFAAMQTALRGGLSVGAVLSLRFLLGSAALFAIVRAKGIPLDWRSLIDGLILGLILASDGAGSRRARAEGGFAAYAMAGSRPDPPGNAGGRASAAADGLFRTGVEARAEQRGRRLGA